MKGFIDNWAEFVVGRRILIIVVTALFFMGMIIPMKNLYFDNSNEMWFVKGDKALVDYDRLTELFGDNEYFLIGIEAAPGDQNVFKKETLEVIAKLTAFLEDHSSISKVSSLTKYQAIRSADDVLTVESVVPEEIEEYSNDPREIARINQIMEKEDLVHDMLISRDFKHTMISARTLLIKGSIEHHISLVRETRQFVLDQKFEESGIKIRFTGTPQISEAFFTNSMKDQGLNFPLMFLLIVIFLLISFRTVAGVLLPLMVIIGTVITILGTIGMVGWAMNMLNVTLPVMLIAVSIGDSVHILIEFYHFRRHGMDAKQAAKEATKVLFIPCLNTSITTSIGFLALSVSKLEPLSQFGLIAAVGVFAAFLFSVITLPALLSFSKSKQEHAHRIAQHGIVARITNNLTDFTFKNNKIISIFSLVIVTLSIWGASSVIADANFVNYFKKSDPMRIDLEYFDEKYNGGINLEMIVDSGREGGVKDPEFLQNVLNLQTDLEQMEKSGKVSSMVNFTRKMNQAMHNDDPAFYKIPESRELVAQYLLLYSNSGPEEDLTDLKSFDERYLRVSQRLENMPSSKMKVLVEDVQHLLDTKHTSLSVQITGRPVLFNNMDIYIQEGLIQSFSLAVGFIIICFFVLLRSVKYGLLALIPSLFPIIAAGGLMGVMGVNLDFGTMIVAAITFGIAVDDTIHILTRYIRSRQSGNSRKEAVHLAVTESGKAIMFTSVILFVGFSILITSSFMPNVYLGFFAGVILLVALVASLTLLPAVMFIFGDKPAKESKEISAEFAFETES